MIRAFNGRIRTSAECSRVPFRFGGVAGCYFGSRSQLSATITATSSSMNITGEDKKRIYVLGTSTRSIFIAAGLGLSSKAPPVSLTTIDRTVYDTFNKYGGRLIYSYIRICIFSK